MNAKQVYDRLVALGHDYNPEKQQFKASIAHLEVTLYHPNSKTVDGNPAPVTIRATEVEAYVGRGFTFELPAAPAPKKGKGK